MSRGHRPYAHRGLRHLHAVLGEHTAYYYQHRPHRARGLRPAGAAGSTGLSGQGRPYADDHSPSPGTAAMPYSRRPATPAAN